MNTIYRENLKTSKNFFDILSCYNMTCKLLNSVVFVIIGNVTRNNVRN